MDRANSTVKVHIPRLQPQEVKGLQDFWEVYESHRLEITAQLLEIAGNHTEFKFSLQNAAAQSSEQETNYELQSRAIYQGEWGPYIKNLQSQGMQYA